jgi:hypothetical protein
VSFAGVSLTVIVLAAIFLVLLALGYSRHRRALIGAVIAFYPATLIFQFFPWYAPTTAASMTGLWVGCFLVCFWALRNRVDPAPWPRLGRGVASLALAAALTAELVALYVSVLPLSTFFALPGWLTVAADVSVALPILLAVLWIF